MEKHLRRFWNYRQTTLKDSLISLGNTREMILRIIAVCFNWSFENDSKKKGSTLE